MREIARTLRERRESRGLTLADAQAATKIRLRYLEALERAEPGTIPGDVYVKGFLRAYAEYLELPARELVDRYKVWRESNGPDEEESPREGRPGLLTRSLGKQAARPSSNGNGAYQPAAGQTQGSRVAAATLEEAGRQVAAGDAMAAGTLLPEGLAGAEEERGGQVATKTSTPGPKAAPAFPAGKDKDLLPARSVRRGRPWLGRLVRLALVLGLSGGLYYAATRDGVPPSTEGVDNPTADGAQRGEGASDNPTAPARSGSRNGATADPVASGKTTAKVPAAAGQVITLEKVINGNAVQFTARGAKAVQVGVVVAGDCWVRVVADGQLAFVGRLTPGAGHLWQAGQRLEVRAGRPDNLRLAVNGVAVPPFQSPEVLDLSFTAVP